MSNTDTGNLDKAEWRLLVQLILPGEAGSEDRAAGLTMEAIRDLKLPAAQLKQIHHAIAAAAHKNEEGGGPHQAALPISITLLVSSEKADNLDAPEHRGWGCFVIKRLVTDAPAAEVGTHHRIELFLYKEGVEDEGKSTTTRGVG